MEGAQDTLSEKKQVMICISMISSMVKKKKKPVTLNMYIKTLNEREKEEKEKG